jgi:subtilisin family serine protease
MTVVILAVLGPISPATVASDHYEPGQVIVKFSAETEPIRVENHDGIVSLGIGSIDSQLARYGVHAAEPIFPRKRSELGRIYQLDFDALYDAREAAADLARDPLILYAEPRYRYRTFDVPDDSFYTVGVQWYLDAVFAPQAWDITHGDSSVIIAMVDTGIDWNHPDLADNIWVNPGEDINGDGRITTADFNLADDDSNGYADDFFGWDFAGYGYPDWNPMENPGSYGSHGSHCAGVASAVTDNHLACAGMAWNCALMAVKTSYDETNDVVFGYEGIQYAADNGADVIHLGWGEMLHSAFGREIIDSAYATGAILVAAAGNCPSAAPPDTCARIYPASYEHVTAVAATDIFDRATDWTCYGTWVDVCAPGQGIYNTMWNDAYAMRQGTSKSCALVAGVAALVRVIDPEMDSDEFESLMRTTSDDIESLNPGYEGWLGGGRLNAYRTLRENVPVVLTGFEAAGGPERIVLTWRTVSEVGCDRWEVHRGRGAGGPYERIGQLPGRGSSDTGHRYRWVDREVAAGVTYGYRLRQVDRDGGASWSGVVTAVAADPASMISTYALDQNRPNPFNAVTEISYRLPVVSAVTLKVYNTPGQEVRRLVDEIQPAGTYRVCWDGLDGTGRRVASGLYFCRLEAGTFTRTVKMVLVR